VSRDAAMVLAAVAIGLSTTLLATTPGVPGNWQLYAVG
jgi:hypothetical protein